MSGWIKLHRQMLDWEWYDDVNVCRLFTHLLLKANHKDKCWKGLTVKAGSLVTGRHVLAQETGLSEKQIRVALDKLKRTGEVAIKTSNKFSVISISCWDQFQEKGQQEGQQMANKGPTKGHKQECNNVKNDKNKYMGAFDEFWKAYPNKKAKGQAEKAFIKIKPDDELLAKMIKAITLQKQAEKIAKEKGEFWPEWKHPSTWLNGKCWEDELKQTGNAQPISAFAGAI